MLISLLYFFFIKCFNDIFTIEIINNICPCNCIFNFFNYKKFFRPIWCVSFSKNIFVIRNSYMMTDFEFRIFIINFVFKINICIILTSTGLILIVLWCVLLYSFTISPYLLIYIFFDIEFLYLLILVFKVLINLSATIDFHVEYISILLYYYLSAIF